jgi:radical SAM protein with 4Fe4S-binding SPASM domain
LNCVHCYNNLPIRDQEARDKELTSEEHCRLLDEITEAGCFWLLYTGGEIFVRKDFLDIYTYAKRKGLLITLFTNGVLITPEIADFLVEWRPFAIEISLYGRTRETYERVTGVPGSYDRCMRGIHLLTERGLPLKLKTMAITINKHELWEMKHFVEEELCLEFRFDPMINPCIDCSQKALSVRLTPQEVIELDLKDPKRVAEWKKFTEQFNGPVYAPGHSEELFHCSAGFNTFAIDPCGMLNACLLSNRDSYDLRKGSFKEGWGNAISHLRHKKISRETKCIHCEIKSMCGMCPANAELENKDPEEPVDFLCQVAHLRAYAMQIPVKPHGECNYCRGGKEYENLMSSVKGLRNRQILSH